MMWVINIAMVIAAFLLMEGAAWAAHKYLMHGALWGLHHDHHRGGYHPFQKNDAFFLIFAVPCWLSTMFGLMYHWYLLFFSGIGIALYGLCYFLVHDVVIHQRFKWFTRSEIRYVKVLRWAHKMHHKHTGKEAGESFGLLIVPRRYWAKILADEERAKRAGDNRQ